MKIYTSYFAKGKALAEKGIVMVSISLYPPKWFGGISMRYVAPSRDILYNSKDNEDYTKRFKEEILSHKDATYLVNTLIQLGRGKDVALCCFEKPEDFCHRHIVAEWLNEQLGLKVEEFGIEPQVEEKPKYIQGNLFDYDD